MEAVLDCPVFAIEVKESCWTGLFWGEARDAIHNLHSRLAGSAIGDCPPDLEDLPDVGELEIVVQLGTGPDLPGFEAAVFLTDRCRLRGEKPPCRGPQYPPGVSVDCL